MTSKAMANILLAALFIFIAACSDAENETHLVELHTVASEDVISISFPEETETVVSISSEVEYRLQGLKSNGVDTVTVDGDVEWSLSAGAVSSINQQGLFTAADTSETLTLTAKFGFLSESIDIRVSSAKFDQVVKLDEDDAGFSINMCQYQTIKPVGRYEDEDGNEEIRLVDSKVIHQIEWLITNEEDGSDSQRAIIETTSQDEVFLHSLASGNIVINAKALSHLTGLEVTSTDFDQMIDHGLNSIKLCDSTDTDLGNCVVDESEIEKDQVISLIAVGNYQAADGSTYNENISRNSKWGIADSINVSSVFSDDRQQLDITGDVEDFDITVSLACGGIEQTIDDISQGLLLDTLVSCDINSDCELASQEIHVSLLSVLSFDVRANNVAVTDNTVLNLASRPNTITLDVTANFSNDSSENITDDSDLDYFIIPTAVPEVIEETVSTEVFTVLNTGTAKIRLEYRGETFIVVIDIP